MEHDDLTPFVAFVQASEDVGPLPADVEDVLPPEGGSFFELLQQKIVDTEEDGPPEEEIADLKSPRGTSGEGKDPGQEANSGGGKGGPVRPPDEATNATVQVRRKSLEERLEPFDELNARETKVPWKERYEVIKTQFPAVQRLDWEKVFRADPTIMGNILNDIIKVEVAPKGRPGKRPALDKEQARQVLKRYQGEDYTLLPFPKAVHRLKGTTSVRQFARKVSMSPSYAYNLMTGYKEPTVEDMQLVAQAYGKHPSYFYEYRVAFITGLMAERVDYAPESSIIYYERAISARQEHA